MIKKIFNLLIDIFFTFVFISAAIVVLMSFTTKKDGIPNIAGYSPFSILSGSMEPVLHKGDIILSEVIDDKYELSEGDIISFKSTVKGNDVIITHRVLQITKLDDGTEVISTKGDANQVSDANTITRDKVVAIFKGKKLPYFGYFLSFIKNKYVFFVGVIFPLAYLFITEFIDLVKILVLNAEEKEKEEQEKEKNKKKSNQGDKKKKKQ